MEYTIKHSGYKQNVYNIVYNSGILFSFVNIIYIFNVSCITYNNPPVWYILRSDSNKMKQPNFHILLHGLLNEKLWLSEVQEIYMVFSFKNSVIKEQMDLWWKEVQNLEQYNKLWKSLKLHQIRNEQRNLRKR